MFAPVTHFIPLTKIRRERVLPVPGKVLVRTGQKVTATDVIAEAHLSSSHVLLDVAGMLGVSPDQADKVLRVSPNQVIGEGDILAGPVGLIPRMVRAPQPGRVIYCSNGQILFELEAQPFQLRAGMEGVIKGLIAERGAIIETTGALIQGVWGNGNVDQGTLLVATPNPKDELLPEMVDASMRGMVLLAGHVTRQETLKGIQQAGCMGLVVASISANLVPVASQYKFPILVLDGFGKIAMNSYAFRILVTNEKREVTVNANNWDRYTDSRPEVIIPLPVTEGVEPPKVSAVFSPGQSVRIVKSPLAGVVGKLIALRSEQTPISNGLRVPSAVINLENGDQTVVPLVNLDVIA
jgi:transcription antitermination factor NusG